jgi:hypothetical protein
MSSGKRASILGCYKFPDTENHKRLSSHKACYVGCDEVECHHYRAIFGLSGLEKEGPHKR